MARIVQIACTSGLSGLLLWALYPPMGETLAIAFALSPLLIASRLCGPGRSAGRWFLGGLIFWLGTISWMPAIVKNNGPLPLVLLGWIGLAAMCAGYFALYGWLTALVWRRCARHPQSFGLRLFALVVAEPVLWAGLEWVRSWMFTGFAWNYLGTALGMTVPELAAPACLGGVYLVSVLVVLLNGVFATMVCRMVDQMRGETVRRSRWLTTLETALPLGLVVLVLMAGVCTFRNTANGAQSYFRVALVQRNAPCIFSKRDRAQDPYQAFERLLGNTAAALKPSLIVWAESAMAEFGAIGGESAQRAARHFSDLAGGSALLTGGDWWYEAEGERRCWNAAALYTPTATNMELQVYGKQHLVPFGEYIPFDKWIRPLQKLSPVGVSIWPGEAKLLEMTSTNGYAKVKLAPLICFEDTDPVLARRAARMGAQAIVLITNDSWFSHSCEAEQHAAQAVLRAIETALPVIRVGNSGVTGIIHPAGWASWLKDSDERKLVDAEGMMVDTVQVRNEPKLTPYARLGDWPLMALLLLVLGTIGYWRFSEGRAAAASASTVSV